MQAALYQWARSQEGAYPELALLFAVPNGEARTKRMNPKTGRWYSPSGQRLKEEGVKAGVPDNFLLVARGPFTGLVLELKVGDNKPDANQKWWIDRLTQEGLLVEVVWDDWERAAKILRDYLDCNFD
jgi:hypothetical protein